MSIGANAVSEKRNRLGWRVAVCDAVRGGPGGL